MEPSFIWNINMRKIFIAVALIVAYAWSVPKPMESITNYNVMMLHGALGADKGISENSEYVSAYEDTTFKF